MALARAAAVGPLRQIVVTTYEEPLGRRLAERHPGHVNLIYVRHGAGAHDFPEPGQRTSGT